MLNRDSRKQIQEPNYNKIHFLNTSCKNYCERYRENIQPVNCECKDSIRYNNLMISKNKSNVTKIMKDIPKNIRGKNQENLPSQFYNHQRENEQISYDFRNEQCYISNNKKFSNNDCAVNPQDIKIKNFRQEDSNNFAPFSTEDFMKDRISKHKEIIKNEWIEPQNIYQGNFDKRINYNHY